MNPRNKRILAILVPASAILIWRGAVLLTGRTPSPAGAQVSNPVLTPAVFEAQDATPATAAGDTLAAVIALQDRRGKLAWVRDPFAAAERPKPPEPPPAEEPVAEPEPPPAPAPPSWILTGIARAGSRRVALLSGSVVGPGDRIDDRYRVLSVGTDRVVIREGEWEHVFVLGESGASTRMSGRLP